MCKEVWGVMGGSFGELEAKGRLLRDIETRLRRKVEEEPSKTAEVGKRELLWHQELVLSHLRTTFEENSSANDQSSTSLQLCLVHR